MMGFSWNMHTCSFLGSFGEYIFQKFWFWGLGDEFLVTGTCWWLVFQILQLGLQIIWKLLKLRPVRYIPDSFWNECPPPSIYETEQWKSFVKIEQHFKTCIVKSTLKISNIHTGCHFEASKSYAQKAKIYFSRLGSFCCFWKSYP